MGVSPGADIWVPRCAEYPPKISYAIHPTMRSDIPNSKQKRGRSPQARVPALAREDMRWLLEPILLNLIHYRGETYGYELARGTKNDPWAFIGFADASVYSSLKRFERKGWVTSYLDESDNSLTPCRYYSLTDLGLEHLMIRQTTLGQTAMYALQLLDLPFVFRPKARPEFSALTSR
jgi:PadR family transcriptional regulator PadR